MITKPACRSPSLSAARHPPDEPADVPRLEKEVADLQAEIEKIKNS